MTLPALYKKLHKTYGPQHWWPAKTPFEVIVGAILTQNTAWGNVRKAILNLKRKNLLSVRRMSVVPRPVLAAAIRPAGYFNVKAQRLKNFMRFLDNAHGGKLKPLLSQRLPALRKGLLSVNGVGPETADSIALYAAKKSIFVVDAYTKRIISRIGLLPAFSSYETVQSYCMARLPRRRALFNEFHALLVEHAKRVCLKKPRCRLCALRSDCRYGMEINC